MLRGIEGQTLRDVISEFKKQHGVGFQVDEWEYDELMRLAREQSKADLPRYEIVLVDDPWMYGLANADRLDKFPELNGDTDFLPSCLRAAQAPCKETGTCYYGVPYVGNSQILCYRKDLTANKPVSDWDDISQLPQPSNHGYRYAMRLERSHPIVADFLPLLWSYSPRSLKENPKDPDDIALDETDDNSAKAIRRLLALQREAPMARMDYQDFDVAAMLAKGRVASAVIWSAYAMQMPLALEQEELDKLKFDQVPGKDQGRVSELGIWILAVMHKSRQEKLARTFVLEAAKRENVILAAKKGNPPVRRSAFESSKLNSMFPSLPVQLESLEKGRLRPRYATWPAVERVLAEDLARLVITHCGPEKSEPKIDIKEINKDMKRAAVAN